MDIVRNAYDRFAQKYHRYYYSRIFYAGALDSLLERLDTDAEILDVGCGSGTALKYMQDKGFCLLAGIDVSSAMLAIAQETFSDVIFRQGDVRHVDLGSDVFAAVISFFSLCHIPKSDLPDVLAKVYRSLAPKGYFLLGLSEGDKDGVFPRFLQEEQEIYYTAFSQDELQEYLERAGFSVVEKRREEYEDAYFGKEQELYFLCQKT